jgi:hypothetical protein
VTTDGQYASAQPAPVPGMPRYRVSGSSEGVEREFATYNEARTYKSIFGGKLRAV